MKAIDIRSLDLALLRTFEALMQERSVSRAAGRLFLSQPAVSASLNRLRELFRDPLFTRTGQGVAPTARALTLAPDVSRILDDVRRLLDNLESFNPATATRIFRIAGSDHVSRLILAPLMRLLADCGSGIRIVWDPPHAGLAHRLGQGELDLGVVAWLETPAEMRTQLLYRDEYVYVVRRDHPLAAGPVTLDAFCAVPQVFLGYGSSALEDLIDGTLARSGRWRTTQLALRSFDQIVYQLRHSDHAAVLGRRVVSHFAEHLAVHPLPFALPEYHMGLCWSPQADTDPGIVWLRATIARIVSDALPPSTYALSTDGSQVAITGNATSKPRRRKSASR